MIARLLFLLFCLAAACASAQYKWTGPDGQIGYGDQAPRDALHVERLGPLAPAAEGTDALAQLPYEMQRAARNFPLVLYARGDCHPCDDARTFLRAFSVPFAERGVATQEDVTAFRELGGADQLPALAVGRRMLRGFEASSWGEALANAGYPRGAAMPQSWQWSAAAPLAPSGTPGVAAPATASTQAR